MLLKTVQSRKLHPKPLITHWLQLRQPFGGVLSSQRSVDLFLGHLALLSQTIPNTFAGS
jgi:hypothetical protein